MSAPSVAPGSARRGACVLCGGRRLDLALSLAPTPIADDFRRPEAAKTQTLYPLDLVLCATCGHVQLRDVVDPEVLFRDYTFTSASSMGLVRHLDGLAAAARGRVDHPSGRFVVDIGSNDGSLLRAFQAAGMTALGIDPAREIARRATESGVETVCAFFDSSLARRLRAERGGAAIVTAANVFAHSDRLADMADGVRELLAPDGIFVFEVSYLVDMVDRMLFDTIYHEHISYHTLAPLILLFRTRGLELFDAERIDSKGGSIRVFVQAAGGSRPVSPAVGELLADEKRRGFAGLDVYRDFAARIDRAKRDLLRLLDRELSGGGTVAGYGASVTTTTLLYHFELGPRLSFLVDDNPAKQGTLSPGYHLPVKPSAALYEPPRPAAAVILAWKYAEPILRRHGRYIKEGGRFLLPLPEATEAAP